jgi:hypothetical protein
MEDGGGPKKAGPDLVLAVVWETCLPDGKRCPAVVETMAGRHATAVQRIVNGSTHDDAGRDNRRVARR